MLFRTGLLALTLAFGAFAAQAQNLVKLKAGMVTGIDQVGLPIALERGFFEKHGVEVEIARPYATGVDALNALQQQSEQASAEARCALQAVQDELVQSHAALERSQAGGLQGIANDHSQGDETAFGEGPFAARLRTGVAAR
jgi:ABC-type nitrate/sulfonate/bicarbonate transport system substrate-binding protein